MDSTVANAIPIGQPDQGPNPMVDRRDHSTRPFDTERALQMAEQFEANAASLRAQVAENAHESADSLMARLGAQYLTEIPTDPPPPLLVDRLDPEGHTVLFGAGGIGKGALTCAWIVQLVQAGHRVLILDYENHPREWSRRLAGLGGDKVRGSVIIARPTSADWGGNVGGLAEQGDDIRRLVEALGITYVVIDSILAAIGNGKPTDSETVFPYTHAVSRFGVPALSLGHVNRSGDTTLPFGSVSWHNQSRMTWSLERRGADLILTQRKANNYEYTPKQSVTLEFVDNMLRTVTEVPAADALRDRIIDVLEEHGPLSRQDIVEQLNLALPDDTKKVEVDSVKKALTRGIEDKPRNPQVFTVTDDGVFDLAARRAPRNEHEGIFSAAKRTDR